MRACSSDLIGAVAVARLLGGLLYGVGALDPEVVFAVIAVASVAGVAAATIPARRAALVDPCTSLRGDG